MKLITRFNQFILESLIEDDETIRSYGTWKLGETKQIDNVYRDLPESAADPTPGYYTLEIIPISKTDLYNDFTRVGSGANSDTGTVPALSREYWAHDDYDGYQTDQLDMIKQGWDSPKRLPIIVEEDNGVYKVIDGHHRLTIAKELVKKSILALVRKEKNNSDSELSYDELFIKLAWPKYYGEGTQEELRSIPELEALLKSLPKPPIESIPEDTRTEWGGVKLGESVSAEELPKIYERMGHYADDSTGKFQGYYKLMYVPVYEKLDKYRLADDYEDLEHYDRVNEYADSLRNGEELPPIIYTSGLFRDGAHRNAAHVEVGRKKILCFFSE